MATVGKSLLSRIGLTLLLASGSTGAWGQVPAPSLPVAPFANLNALTRIQGAVVCVGCSLEEAQQWQSGRLYELRHVRSRAVLRVDEVEDAARWASITLGHRLSVRTAAVIWQQLTAEENLFREVEITGLLSSDRTLDVAGVVAKKESGARRKLFGSED